MSYHQMVQWLEKMPNPMFWADCEGGRPDYKGIMIQVLMKFTNTALIEELSPDDIPNPSSFQRAVAREAKNRREQREVSNDS